MKGKIMDKATIKKYEKLFHKCMNIVDKNMLTYGNYSEEEQLLMVMSDDYSNFDKIKNPTEKIQVFALCLDGEYLKNIKNPSEDLQLFAVESDGYAIEHIKNPSEKIQLAAVEGDYPESIQYIKNPSEKVQLAAIKDTIDIYQ